MISFAIRVGTKKQQQIILNPPSKNESCNYRPAEKNGNIELSPFALGPFFERIRRQIKFEIGNVHCQPFSGQQPPRASAALTLTETYDLADLRIFLTESVLSGLFWAIGIFTGDSAFNGRVSFAYAKPDYWQSYKDRFGNDLSFDQPITEVIIPEQLLSLSSPVADPAMHKDAVAICERLLSERTAARSITEAVTTLISDNPGVIWTLADVARNLHIGTRTLMRRLDAEGTKFQTLRDNLSKQQAANNFADQNLSVESVGYLMGFSDASSFRRSFKRWFGETPSAYIARIRGND